MGDTSVIEVAREALAALAGGIDAAGDRFGIWGFSSLRRDRVFVTRCKGFETRCHLRSSANIGALRPGHYTRLGAAIRHVSAHVGRTDCRAQTVDCFDRRQTQRSGSLRRPAWHRRQPHGRRARPAAAVKPCTALSSTKTGRIGLPASLGVADFPFFPILRA